MKIAKKYQDFRDKIKNIKAINKSKTQVQACITFAVNMVLSALSIINIKHRAHIYIQLKNWWRQFSRERPWVKQNIVNIIIDCHMIKALSTNFCHAWQILSVKKKPPTPLFLTDNIKMDRIPIKIKWKVHTFFTLYFKFWREFLWKICKMHRPDYLFLFVFMSFYISRYHFSQISALHSKISEKKYFHHKFFFLADSLRPPA